MQEKFNLQFIIINITVIIYINRYYIYFNMHIISTTTVTFKLKYKSLHTAIHGANVEQSVTHLNTLADECQVLSL
jgi:hypothetical protein